MNLKETVLSELKNAFPDIDFAVTDFRGELSVSFPKEKIVAVSKFLKENENLSFNYCEDVTAIDWASRKNRFTIVYHIFSMKNNFRLRLRCTIDEKDSIETVSSVWDTANWEERETYDMFGIQFKNHPDLRRMYMPEEFEYYPLKKEFPLMGIPGSLHLPKK